MKMSCGGAGGVTVVVAVKSAEGSGSQRAVRWAAENLMPKADRLLLVHVMPTITSVPTPSGVSMSIKELDARVVAIYSQDMRKKCEESFLPFKYMCRTQNVETLVLEGDNPAFALLRYISDSRTTSLVLGSCSSSYFTRKLMDSTVPSIVLKHAPETCNIYVISAHKLTSNSLHPMLSTAERECDFNALSKQESFASSSTMDSKCQQHLSNISHSQHEAYTQVYSSTYSGSVQETATQNSENSLSDVTRAKKLPSISSTYSEQSNTQAEMERLRLELETTITMYSRACKDLVHAESEVRLLSYERTQEAQKVNAAQEREERLRRIGGEQKEKYLAAEKEVEMAKGLLAKEAYERQMAELKAQRIIGEAESC